MNGNDTNDKSEGTGSEMVSPWRKTKDTVQAKDNIELFLVENAGIPLSFWRKSFFFFGALDEDLHRLSGGRFSREVFLGKTHPVFCLGILPHGVGATACPCSSIPPFKAENYRFIRKGCRLLHTGYLMDRNSHLIESCHFNVPRSFAPRLSFKGEIPDKCLVEFHRRRE